MRIAISGASGLVGTAVSSSLVLAGHQVCRLVRAASAGAGAADTDMLWDPDTGLLKPQMLNGCDALVHLAGHSIASRRWSLREKQRIRDSRVRATQLLSEQIVKLEAPPPVIVSASAIGIYGDCGSQVVDESSPTASGFLAELSADWEGACQPLVEAGLRVAHPRLGIVLSKQGGALQKMLPLFRFGLGGRLGSGGQYWSWIGIHDCVAAIVWLLGNAEARGGYNLVAPTPITNRDFTRLLAAQISRPALLPVPSCALRLGLGEMADAMLLCSCRVVPTRLRAEGYPFQHPDLESFLDSELRT